ncbi:trichohyalin-like isoform X3 [Eriocheir sinensis]|uniref:trichohyalin-like isoform X3 n=1 Tax=Eriocheir sinensis TaxID=95602 RepID=UPI0021C9CCDE|nr:trichohyalin-like isoform X3 [Eriocheir sinensis]
MFGFFKTKSKDKVVNKEKNSDSAKDKKKDKTNKEEAKVNVRKGKEDKASRSLFRKSKSIERAKEGNENARKSQSLDSQGSGDWSDHEQSSRQDSGPVESEEVASSPGPAGNSSSSEDAARPTSPCRLEVADSRSRDDLKSSDSTESSGFKDSLTSSQEGELHTESEAVEERKHDKKYPLGVQSTAALSKAGLQDPRNGEDLSLRRNTQPYTGRGRSRGSESPTTLMMKPPLNPRIVAPRGPLATTTTITSFHASSTEPSGERDESRLTPSPGMVTPPASPGLFSQMISTHQNVNNLPSRPTSPDGRTSMLSTPSSSTSSLSSLTARPISPSGRRTPPGPRMGTGGKLTSSPTAGRKPVRTNIKTNPSMGSRRAGSHSPINSPPSPGGAVTYADADNIKTPPSSPLPLRHVLPEQAPPPGPCDANVWMRPTTYYTSKLATFSPPITRREIDPPTSPSSGRATASSPPGKLALGCSSPPPPRLSTSAEVKPEGGSSPGSQRSVSPTVGKARHSISSMHSLESIPENDSDGQSPVASEKTLDGSCKPSRALPSNRPNSTPSSPKEQQQTNVTATRPTRHSAPEVTCERQHSHSTTHRRSSSLTPVNEERKIHFSVSISETKTTPGDEMHSKGLNAEAGKAAEENSSSKRDRSENPHDISNRKKTMGSPKEPTNPDSKEVIRKEKVPLVPPVAAYVKAPGGMAVSKQADAGSLAVTVAKKEVISQGNDTKEIYKKNSAALSEKNKPSAVRDDGKESEEATHVVFRIPLRRSSLANGEEAEKRSSVEILSREAGRSKRREREHCKERPRSVSTSRELRRERTSDRLPRRRMPSEGNESRNELATNPENEGKKGVTERVRSRSSSSRRTKGLSPDQTGVETPLVANGNESYDGEDEEVVIPWRRAPRSRSLVSRVDGSSDAARSDEPPTNTQGQAASGGGAMEGPNKKSEGCEDNSPSLVTAPLRQRSKSRGPERRMTRSVTLSEIKRAGEGMAVASEQKPQRRSRSSSRLQEGSRSHGGMRESVKPVAEGDDAKAHASPRRKLSTKRSVSRTRKEGEEGARRLAGDAANSTKGTDYRSKGTKSKDSQNSGNLENAHNKTNRENDTANEIKDTEKSITGNKGLSELTVESNSVETQTATAETKCVELQTEAAETNSKLCQTEEDLEPRVSQRDLKEHTRKELGAQEERYQKQIDELTLSLAAKQEEVTQLAQTLETLKGAQETLNNSEELQEKLSLLQQDVRDRNAQLDCARTELETSKEEMELTKAKLKKLEEDLDSARQKNLSLQNQITASANCDKTEELETKIKSLEEKLKATEEERDKLTKTIDETEAERDEEIKIIQDALDEAAQEREDLIATFEKEIQNMTTMNSTREQQLMEDFEWKLREMEKDHKKKMEERDRKAEERISAVRNMVESELADSLIKVAEDRRVADEQLMEVGHLKSYEAEAIQLRGVTHELQKALRASAREMEHLKVREKILEEEIRGLKKAPPPCRQSTLQRAKRQAEETEAEFRQKQEKMKNELNAEWEDKLRSECSRLKAELDELHGEEKHLAVESMKVQKEQEVRKLRQSWEQRQEEMTKEISTLKDSLTEKDAYYHKEMENMRTNADRDVWELRRKLQRLDEKNWSQQELLQEKHHEELERIRAEYKERSSDLEARLAVALQNSDEEGRHQAEKQHNEEMEHLCEQHRLSMERLREELEAEKFQAVEEARVIVTKHHEYLNAGLQEQLTEAITSSTQCKEELEAVKSALALREEVIKSLNEELARLKESEGGVPAASYMDSQSSIASSSESTCSQGSNNSQDRLSLSESVGASIDGQDEAHKSGC